MVDPIGPRQTASIDRRIAPVANVAAPQPVQPAVQDQVARADPSTLRSLAQAASQQAPIDHERVARIKKAVEEGTIPAGRIDGRRPAARPQASVEAR